MADVIKFDPPQAVPSAQKPLETYSMDVTLDPDELHFTLRGITVSRPSLYKIASELERIAHILRSDAMTEINK